MTKHICVIGAGHNGLVASLELARRGFTVTVLEANEHIGGGAQTHEFAPGFKSSSLAHLLFHWDDSLTKRYDLARFGFKKATPSPLPTLICDEAGEPLTFNHQDLIKGSVTANERERLRRAFKEWNHLALWLDRQHHQAPPRLGWTRWWDAIPALQLGLSMRLLGREPMRELLRKGTMAAFDVLEESFHDERIKAALAVDSILGTHLGPRSGNTFFTLLHRLSGVNRNGGYSAVKGGLGSLTQALVLAAKAQGVVIETGALVTRMTTESGVVSGVELADGRVIRADGVVSAIAAKSALLELLGAQHISVEQTQRLHHIRHKGSTAKVHLALNGLPQFKGITDPRELGARLIVAASSASVDDAFNPVKYQQMSEQPILECHIPTIHDESMAPAGQHVLSAIVQYVPYSSNIPQAELRELVLSRVIHQLERVAPDIRQKIVASECFTPRDIETRFRMPQGHWHHAEMTIDQALMLRPIPQLAQYRGPIKRLWLCGASTHPGGGVMGLSAQNMAKVVAEDIV